MKRSKLRFGVVGVGRIGKIHIENLVKRIPGAEVAAIADVAAAELEAVAATVRRLKRRSRTTGICWTCPKWTRS